MAEKMKVELGAEIKEFQTKLKEAIKGLDKLKQEEKSLKKEFDKGAISADKYYKQLAENSVQSKKLSANTNKLKSSLAGLDKNMSKTAKETANGSSAMLAFSRTVQDAPFGLLGISNNITNLTEQFGALKNRTGSAGGALKLMLRDLKGFGGITLGISAATSLLLVFGDKIFKTKDKVKDLRKEQEDLNKSLDNYVFGLETVNRANLKGSQNAQRELVTLRLLKEQVNDTTISLSKRKDALNQLRDKYPSYLKNMSDEKALNGGLNNIYKELTQSILDRAKATASLSTIVDNEKKLIVLRSQLAQVSEKLKKEEDEIKNKRRFNAATGIAQQFNEIKNARERATKELNKLKGQIQNLELSNIDLEQNVKVVGGINPLKGGVKTPKEPVKIPYVLERVVKNNELEVPELIDIDEIGVEPEPFDWDNYYNLKAFDEKKAELTAKMQSLAEGMQRIKDSSLTSALSGIGESIGSALANGTNVLESLGKSLLKSFGQYLSKMGSQMILYGKLAVAKGKLDIAVAAGGPAAIVAGAASIKLGILAVAAGAAIGALAQKGFSGGGGSSSSVDTNAGGRDFSSGTAFNSNVKEESNEGMQLVLKGEDLYGSVDTFRRRRGNMGTNLNLG